jgi:hypothetical protein
MIKSRCGIVCDTQKCKAAFGVDCAGCVNIKQPFHGQCAVKTCCEGKKHGHCGVCEVFPCEALHSFSYDKVHGDNGARIEQCKEWAMLIP